MNPTNQGYSIELDLCGKKSISNPVLQIAKKSKYIDCKNALHHEFSHEAPSGVDAENLVSQQFVQALTNDDDDYIDIALIDLSECDFSSFTPMRFEIEAKSEYDFSKATRATEIDHLNTLRKEASNSS